MAQRGIGVVLVMFKKKSLESEKSKPLGEFSFLPSDKIYLDAACQSLRPLAVQNKLTDYYLNYNACGERAKYAWAVKVDEEVASVRAQTLKTLKLSSKLYETSFTLNTSYGINLLLQGLLTSSYERIITSEKEHNSVFLPTQNLAKAKGIPREVLPVKDGKLIYDEKLLANALVVVSAVSNVDGERKENLKELIELTHRRGGLVIVDAAQAFAHEREFLQQLPADAFVFSAHKAYGPSLGVVVATKALLATLDITFIGGGQVASVSKDSYELLPNELHTRLEPGLQAWGEIIAFGESLRFLAEAKPERLVHELAVQLHEGLRELPLVLLPQHSSIITFHSERIDSHRLNGYLAHGGIMARSGFFCSHYYLQEVLKSAPLIRFSVGASVTQEQLDKTITTLSTILKGL